MVEVLAAIGLGAKELFNYNRESYKFDQDQRLEREMLRLEMQVKRFELFREDIRDMVELTVGRMDVYHLVGALFLEFCVAFFCEGRVQASAPPFILSLFLLSNACAFVYLLLAVWLSMHASIASHSFGVRLLTRFVRLPIPSPQQIANLSRKLAEFEAQGICNVLRLPVVNPIQQWAQPMEPENIPDACPGSSAASISVSQSAASPSLAPSSSSVHPQVPVSVKDSSAGGQEAVPAPTANAAACRKTPQINTDLDRHSLLGAGERPFAGEEMLLRPAASPGLHVQLFRRLQAKWQCYDAYCRVCMALGVNQLLQSLSYYAIVHTLVENRSASAGYALVVIFQGCAMALAKLDIAGLPQRLIFAVQLVGSLPAFLAAFAVHGAVRNQEGAIDPHQTYWHSPAMFLLQALWLELLLHVAAPSKDGLSLPRRMRTVLYLDVFGDGTDPEDEEYRPPPDEGMHEISTQQQLLVAERVAAAEVALVMAQAAVRRWDAGPAANLSIEQSEQLRNIKQDLIVWQRALHGELAWRAVFHGLPDVSFPDLDSGLQPWGELSQAQKEEDIFAGFLLGPFEHDTGYATTSYHYDVEQFRYVWELPGRRPVLTLSEAAAAVRGLEGKVRLLLAMGEFEKGAVNGATSDSPFAASRQSLPRPLKVMLSMLSLPRYIAGRLVRKVLPRANDGVEMVRNLDSPLLTAVESPSARAERARLAGPHAKHFSPERLPWQILRSVTRLLQFAWGFTGTMAVLRELGIFRMDYQQHLGRERRLLAGSPTYHSHDASTNTSLGHPSGWLASSLPFELLNVMWPYGSFFEVDSLACMPITQSLSSPGMVVGSPFHTYWMPLGHSSVRMPAGSRPDSVTGLPFASSPSATFTKSSLAHIPIASGVVPMCGEGHCFWGALEGNALRLSLTASDSPLVPLIFSCNSSQSDNDTTLSLPIVGRPWRMLSGSVVRCDEESHQPLLSPAINVGFCLLIAGWDGKRLPIAFVPLSNGPGCFPRKGSRVQPRYSAPLTGTASVLSLSVSAQSKRLWVLLSGGRLSAWDLAKSSQLGHWQVSWIANPNHLQLVGICEVEVDRSSVLYVAGRVEDPHCERDDGACASVMGGRPVILQASAPAG